jgi:hypothetical protein
VVEFQRLPVDPLVAARDRRADRPDRRAVRPLTRVMSRIDERSHRRADFAGGVFS